jgi:hypothetical protein
MQERTQNRIRERGKDGRFITIRNSLEDTYDILCVMMKLIPFMIIGIILLNYFGLWKHIKHTYYVVGNLGDPNCRFTCTKSGLTDDVE